MPTGCSLPALAAAPVSPSRSEPSKRPRACSLSPLGRPCVVCANQQIRYCSLTPARVSRACSRSCSPRSPRCSAGVSTSYRRGDVLITRRPNAGASSRSSAYWPSPPRRQRACSGSLRAPSYAGRQRQAVRPRSARSARSSSLPRPCAAMPTSSATSSSEWPIGAGSP